MLRLQLKRCIGRRAVLPLGRRLASTQGFSARDHWQLYQKQLQDPVQMDQLKKLEMEWMLKQKQVPEPPKNDSTEQPDKETPVEVPEEVPETPEKVPEKTPEKTEDKSVEKQVENKSSVASAGDSSGSSNGGSDGGDDDKSSKKSKKHVLPEVYPQVMALPISRRPLFPGFYKAVVISDPNAMRAIKDMLDRKQPYIGAFLLKNSDVDTDVIKDVEEVYDVGVFAQITSAFPSKDEKTGQETLTTLLYPHRRIKIDELFPPTEDAVIDETSDSPTEFLKSYEISLVNVSNLKDQEFDKKSPVINALTSEILKVFKEISQLNTMFREQIATFSASMQSATTNIFEEPAKLADFAAAVSAGEEEELQEILSSLDVEQRLEKSLIVLKKELMNAELQNKISKDVETKIQKRQREYYLMEQLKGIKRELGIDDGRDKLIETFKERVSKLTLPPAVQKIFDDEVNKLATLETSMSEFGVIRNYLDWITSLPWGKYSEEQFSIPRAQEILNEDHYGLKDVKDRILEFIAVGKLLGAMDGKIICLVGPPGVGKTSIGKSIARSLDRQFYRFSVGGMTDVAEIKGHRRTYIGALPGRIIQALKKCETSNPLILIDEIDKIGHGGIHGDPSAALLELLDPEQNSTFLDNYMDIPIDLSKVLFVCTANTLDTIPRPLLDRMEVIELSGYVADEKVKIAENYLIPQAKKLAGLADVNVSVTPEAIEALIKQYCRESGVRNLKKHVEKIYRKAALNVVKELETEDNVVKVPESVSVEVKPESLKDYVGPPVFTRDRLYEQTPPGVVMGLAWTSMGGCSMYVESVLEQPLSHKKGPSFERTGQLGDVMKESSRLAYSFSKMLLTKKFPENRFFEQACIHLHCPEGATPKDGPSAGVTMTSSLLSLALDKPLDPTVAMTGELTLTGKVLRIGGLREKAVAAKRSGATTIIFPKDNMSDWLELPENIREGLTPLAADWYQDIYERLFGDISLEQGNNVWKKEFEQIDAAKKDE